MNNAERSGRFEVAMLAIEDMYEGELPALLAELLARGRKIAAVWGVADVRDVRPDLSDDQCWEVLQLVDRWQDAEHGICWQTLEEAAEVLFGEAPEGREDGDE